MLLHWEACRYPVMWRAQVYRQILSASIMTREICRSHISRQKTKYKRWKLEEILSCNWFKLLYKDLPSMYLIYVCCLKDLCYYQTSDDQKVVKDYIMNIHSAYFSFYSPRAKLIWEIAHSNSWWMIWQIAREIWKGSINPKSAYSRPRQTFPYASSLL